MITILFIGDIVGKPARKAITKLLPQLKKECQPNLTIANAENIAHGVGVTKKTLTECREAGVDFFTSGNHIWSKPEVYDIFKDPSFPLLRPANDNSSKLGTGYKTVAVQNKVLLVINLNGQVFMENDYNNPFYAVDEVLNKFKKKKLAGCIIDFHAEATSEKIAFGWYVDGRVSAVLGTHTHIPTADETILPQGTAYITDVGMVGLKESVIGINKEVIISNFLGDKKSHEIAERGKCAFNAVLLTIDPATRKSKSITRIHKEITV